MFYQKKGFWAWTIINGLLLLCLFTLLSTFNNTKTLTVKTNYINIYTKSSINSPIKSQITNGQKFEITEDLKNWYQVKTNNGRHGWVNKFDLKQKFTPQPYNIPTTIKQKTKLYNNTTTKSAIIQNIRKDSTVYLLNKFDNFVLIKTKNKRYGWIPLNSLKSDAQNTLSLVDERVKNLPKNVYAKDNYVKLYASPSAQSKVVKTLKAETKLNKGTLVNGWYPVTTQGTKGYVNNLDVVPCQLKKPTKKANKSLKGKLIVIDPGHGGEDPGSISNGNRHEADATLQTSETIKRVLEENGAKVITTRDKDTYVTLAKRAEISNKEKADAFICIHYDSTEKKNVATGTTTYYYNQKSKPLADALNYQLATTLPMANKGVKYGDHQVTRDNKQPAVLLELGYLSTDEDANKAFSEEYQQLVANAILNGLNNYFA